MTKIQKERGKEKEEKSHVMVDNLRKHDFHNKGNSHNK